MILEFSFDNIDSFLNVTTLIYQHDCIDNKWKLVQHKPVCWFYCYYGNEAV